MLRHLSFLKYLSYKDDGVVADPVLAQKQLDLLCEYGYASFHEAEKINNASYKRIKRLRDRITQYLNMGDCVFLTLTFSDACLENTSEKTRRDYVRDYLKSVSEHYLANIDYGVDDRYTHREHYHALVVAKEVNTDAWTLKCGFAWRESVHRDCCEVKLAKYISKLTNHAIKKSTRRYVYIYSRSKI